ncbi:MAG: hypothetical protein AAFX93_02580 [Verrucomicrobiota bacterium]
MLKYVTAFLSLALPSLAFAHGDNDLSHGAAHWLTSLNHFAGMLVLAVIVGVGIWWVTRPKQKPDMQRVRNRD